MEQNNQGQNNTCSMCGGCGSCHGHHKMHLLRWVLGIVIIFMIFSFGVKIGEFKSAFENNEGYYGGSRMMRGSYGQNMMYGSYGQVRVQTPATVTGTTKK